MANCPKCGEHLRLIDWKQKCPHCGANIVLYDLQERLMQDADKAEVQYYHFQKKIDRLKASFVGTKLSIVRIVTSIIPLLALLLPTFKFKVADVLSAKFSIIDAIGYGDLFTDEVLDGVMTALGIKDGLDIGKLLGISGVLPLVIAVLGLVLSIVMLLLHLVLLTLACSPHAKKRGYILNTLMLLFTLVFVVGLCVLPKAGVVSGTVGIGAFAYLVLMVVNSAIDLTVLKKGTPVHHKQCYCGGIPIEEYFEMVKRGVPQEEIRALQYEKLAELQAQKELEMAQKEAEAAAKEAAEAGEVTDSGK